MSSAQRLALGCMLPGFEGVEPPDWLRRRIADGLGGVVLFGRNVQGPEQLRRLTDALHAERADLVVAIDEEGGEVTRLEARTGSSYPGNLALGRADDVELTAEVAAAIGAELAAAGIDLDLAPVADVSTDPRNPIVGARAFGSDAHLVARHTAAWVQGLQGAGVAACAKHFPGHGDTSTDSHVGLPVVGEDPHVRALEPFRAAIAAGVRAIMSAHIVASTIDEQPATLSARIMTRLLRDELGFTGVAVSDGLDMRGVSGERDIAQVAVAAVKAGCDALVVGGGPRDEQVVVDIADALAANVPEERLREAASRVVEVRPLRRPAAATYAPRRGKDGAPSALRPENAPRVGRSIGMEAARRALCVDGDVRVGGAASVVTMPSPSSIAAGEVPWGMAGALQACGVRLDGEHARLVVVVRDLHRQPENQREVERVLAAQPDGILVEMGVPVHRPQSAKNYIATFGSARVCADAAAERMTGRG